MKYFLRNLMVILTLPLLQMGCDVSSSTGGTETGNASSSDSVSLAISNSVDAVSSSLSSDASALSALAVEESSVNAGFKELTKCSDDDPEVEVEIECDDTAKTATIIRNFGSGCDAGSGIIVTGKQYVSWLNMGNSACSNGTSRPRLFKATQGTGAKQIISTDTVSNTNTCGTPLTAVTRTFLGGGELNIIGCHELDYSNFQTSSSGDTVTETLTINNESRIRLKTNGSKLFDHTISSPTPLTIDLEKAKGDTLPTRKVTAGEVDVSHNLAKYTVHSIYQNVQYDYRVCPCHPISGSINVTVTDNTSGSTLGTGSITFTETTTGSCDTADATYQGTSVTLSLGSCRGI